MTDTRVRLGHQAAPADAHVVELHGREALSEPFDLVVEFATADANLDIESWLWTPATLELADRHSGSARCFHGIVEEGSYLGAEALAGQLDGRVARYRLRLRPHVHGLDYRVRTRIFQDQSVVDLVEATLRDSGIPSDAYEWRTRGTYEPVEYQVGWRESEMAHVHRRLESWGIFYFFEHDAAGHRMVFVDQPFQPDPIEGDPILPVYARAELSEHEVSSAAFDLRLEARVTHDAFASRDWSCEQPEAPRQAEVGAGGRFPRFEYPGGYRDEGLGARLAQIRLEERLGRGYLLTGKATCKMLCPGRSVTLLGAAPAFLDDDYLLESVEHRYEWAGLDPAAASAGRYQATFRARRASDPFRPARRTPCPRPTGLESAVVTGPGGEEIHTDDKGRVKVHFYWDRENPVDETASCWMRVQQLNTSGSLVLPRVGWELWIAFLDADPDRPVALYKAYNRETMPPYAQPANNTQSSLQSSTSPGGGSVNEIRLQDGNGGMEWAMSASKDLAVKALNNSAESIGVSLSETVGGQSSVVVGASDTVSIGANQSVAVAGKGALETAGSKQVTVAGTDDWGTTGNFAITCDGSRDESIGSIMNVVCNSGSEMIKGSHDRTVSAIQAWIAATTIAETVGGSKTETVTAAKAEILGANHEERIKGLKTLNSGLVKIDAGKDVTVAAKGAIAINSAGVIDIDAAADVTVSGTVVTVLGPGGVEIKGGGGKLELGGTTVTVDASKFGGSAGPQLEVKGPIDYAS